MNTLDTVLWVGLILLIIALAYKYGYYRGWLRGFDVKLIRVSEQEFKEFKDRQ